MTKRSKKVKIDNEESDETSETSASHRKKKKKKNVKIKEQDDDASTKPNFTGNHLHFASIAIKNWKLTY